MQGSPLRDLAFEVEFRSHELEKIGFDNSAINVLVRDADANFFTACPGADRTIGQPRTPSAAAPRVRCSAANSLDGMRERTPKLDE